MLCKVCLRNIYVCIFSLCIQNIHTDRERESHGRTDTSLINRFYSEPYNVNADV